MFLGAGKASNAEFESRYSPKLNKLCFGIPFLDDALRGIMPDDLILIGAPSGLGKTQLCVNIAKANLVNGHKVHYIALEASQFEIERRIKYPMVVEAFFADRSRPILDQKINFPDWLLGRWRRELLPYELEVNQKFAENFKNLFLYYKQDRFGLPELIESVLSCSSETDLIIIDHVHYFDFDDDNENRALKEIAKTVRMLALEESKPIILVAHLRKRDRYNDELVAGLDEFHGSSDLCKIATKVITFTAGKQTTDGNYETFFRLPKNRVDGSVQRFIGRSLFNPRRGGYEPEYKIGWSNQSRKEGFAEIERSILPLWAAGKNLGTAGSSGSPDRGFSVQLKLAGSPGGPGPLEGSYSVPEGNRI